jgi:hypothetical protein
MPAGQTNGKEQAVIKILPNFPDGVVACRIAGTVHTDDYEQVIIPAVEAGLARHEKLRIYCAAESEVTADAGAMWDDFKLGVSHFTRWERIALVSSMTWLPGVARTLSFLMPGEIRTYSPAEAAQAKTWISEGL